jgi:hypothetical protein
MVGNSPKRKRTGKKTKLQSWHTLERLQQPEIELQQNNAVVRIWLPALLQICQSMPPRNAPSVRCPRADRLKTRFGVAAASKTGGRKTRFRPTLRSTRRDVGVDG